MGARDQGPLTFHGRLADMPVESALARQVVLARRGRRSGGRRRARERLDAHRKGVGREAAEGGEGASRRCAP